MPLSDEDILLIIDAAWKEYIPALQSYVILNPLHAIEILKEITKRPNVNLQALRMLGKCYLDGNIVEQDTNMACDIIETCHRTLSWYIIDDDNTHKDTEWYILEEWNKKRCGVLDSRKALGIVNERIINV